MALKVLETYTITDDFDGKALPEDTTPVILEWDGQRVSAYLSDANREKIVKVLGKVLDNATPVTPERATSGSGRSRGELEALRAWAKHAGYKIGERGRIASDVLTAWDDAGHPGWGTGKPVAAESVGK